MPSCPMADLEFSLVDGSLNLAANLSLNMSLPLFFFSRTGAPAVEDEVYCLGSCGTGAAGFPSNLLAVPLNAANPFLSISSNSSETLN